MRLNIGGPPPEASGGEARETSENRDRRASVASGARRLVGRSPLPWPR
ncbi:MAG: hypothetical protein AAFQ43_07650 [Bacteroidota bacterium]